ncbi:MAG: hypothetical protein AABY22_01270, partial [Nanoarchaeota archaeon]
KNKELEDGMYLVDEGEVLYALTETGEWTLWKLKSSQIEAIHWASGGIGKNIIIATCWNAFENCDEPTVDNIMTLLLEEFKQPEIDKIYYSIQRHLNDVHEKLVFKKDVLEKYHALEMSILTNKVPVLHAMSTYFPKHLMSRVFGTIEESEIK